jgi:hypothetical protein
MKTKTGGSLKMEEPTNTDSKLTDCVSSLDQILLQNSTIASQEVSTKFWFKTQLLHLKRSQPNFDSKLNYCISSCLNQILIQNSTIASQAVSTKSWFKTQLLHLKKSQPKFEAILNHVNSFGWDPIERIHKVNEKEAIMLSGYNHKWPKKLNFHLGQPKRVLFVKWEVWEKMQTFANYLCTFACEFQLFFFPWLFKHGYHRTCSYWS